MLFRSQKERVNLIGNDQRITSGPAVKRPHSKAEYMTAPERFAESQFLPCTAGAVHTCEGEVSTSPFIAPTRKTMWGEGGDFKMGPGHQEKIVTFDFGSLDKFPPGEFRIICPNLVTPFKPYK